MQKRAQGPKVKVTTKVADIATDKVEKTNQTKETESKTKFEIHKYIANSGRDADIYIQSGTVK
jgi:23S rRNA pseudouridine2605 synthase